MKHCQVIQAFAYCWLEFTAKISCFIIAVWKKKIFTTEYYHSFLNILQSVSLFLERSGRIKWVLAHGNTKANVFLQFFFQQHHPFRPAEQILGVTKINTSHSCLWHQIKWVRAARAAQVMLEQGNSSSFAPTKLCPLNNVGSALPVPN